LLGNAGYWGPPGALPPPGCDAGTPLLAQAGLPIPLGVRPPQAQERILAAAI